MLLMHTYAFNAARPQVRYGGRQLPDRGQVADDQRDQSNPRLPFTRSWTTPAAPASARALSSSLCLDRCDGARSDGWLHRPEPRPTTRTTWWRHHRYLPHCTCTLTVRRTRARGDLQYLPVPPADRRSKLGSFWHSSTP